MSTKSVDFRPLPTPEQVRAHGEGGLWEAPGAGGLKVHYKFWDRDRTTPWYDCSSPSGSGFCGDGQPWKYSAKRTPTSATFRPLNPDGTPRDWAEIDAIVARGAPSAVAAEPEPEPDYRAPTDAELRAHVANGGVWQREKDGTFYEIWADEDCLKGWQHNTLPSRHGLGWNLADNIYFSDHRKHLRPVDRQGKPMPWPKAAAAAEDWRPLPDTETLKLHRYWRSQPDADGDVYYIHTTQTGKYDITEDVDELPTLSQWSEIDTDRCSDEWLIGVSSHRWQPCDVQGNILPWSAITKPTAQPSAPTVTPPPDGKFQAGDVVKVLRFSDDERFEGGNPQWNREMEHCLDAPTTVVGFGAWCRVKDPKNPRDWWNWPVERVSFVSRPSKAEPEQKPAEVTAPVAAVPEFRKLTREIVEANPGQLWERNTSADRDYKRVWKLAYDEGTLKSDYVSKNLPWNSRLLPMADVSIDQSWRPLHPSSTPDNREPMPWSELKAVPMPQPISVRLSDSEPLTFSVAGPVSSAGRLISHADSLGASAMLQIEEVVQKAIAESMSLNRFSIDVLAASDLDIAAEQWYSLSRQPNETDEQLRQRCRDAKAKENPMPSTNHVASLGTPIPDFTKLSPEDRARYRAALDAADPPTFRDALRSGLEHAPVELALDKLHTFVSRLADLWTEGNEEERATVRRFLRDLLSSDYGKAAIGLGAGAAIPHAAPLAAKLLPDDKDAGPLLRRVGFILVERGTATGAKRLGLDIWDAAGPMLDELRQMLRDLVKGMKQADTVVGFLPPASPKLDFASGVGVVEAETVTQKR